MTVKQIEGYQIYMSKVLGKGSYGSVYLGKKDGSEEQVAVKILPKDSIDQDDYLKAALKNQIDILQKVHSENIVGFHDVMESSKNYYIIQQLCDGDLTKEIKRFYQRPETEAVEMLRQICNGFLALVKEGIIHRDLKPANIMKKGNVLKLGDFGFAKQMREDAQMAATCVGTPLYMSLEILKGENYTSKCDIWALGFIFYEILHGNTPWTANTEHQLVSNIQKQPLAIRRKDLSQESQHFLKKCLEVKQANRISWDEIFLHPIFKGYFITKSSGREFQNKLKMIMNKLRFYISKMNLDMKKIMDFMGFGENKNEITYNDFYSFLQNAYPEITKEEADYCFKKTDTDSSGTISVSELKHMLLENGIKIDSQFDTVPTFQSNSGQEETFLRISKEASNKVQGCFQKLYKIITRNNLTLQKVFNDFDKKKGSLNLSEFSLLLKKLSGSTMDFNDEEIRMGFRLIDLDGSDSIEFEQLNNYYSKINGIPISTNLPPNKQLPPDSLFKNSAKHKNALEKQQYAQEPMSIQPSYPPQPTYPTYPSQQPTYPSQQPTYPSQQPSYPPQQPSYPPQQPIFAPQQNVPQTNMQQQGYNNFNQVSFQANQGYQSFPSQSFQPGFENNGMSLSGGNTGNYYSPNFNAPLNLQGTNPNPFQNSFPGAPNYPSNPNYPGQAQGQGFLGNQNMGQGQGQGGVGSHFNPFDLLGRRI